MPYWSTNHGTCATTMCPFRVRGRLELAFHATPKAAHAPLSSVFSSSLSSPSAPLPVTRRVHPASNELIANYWPPPPPPTASAPTPGPPPPFFQLPWGVPIRDWGKRARGVVKGVCLVAGVRGCAFVVRSYGRASPTREAPRSHLPRHHPPRRRHRCRTGPRMCPFGVKGRS